MFDVFRCDLARYAEEGDPWPLTLVKAGYSHPSFVGVAWYRAGRFCWLRRRWPWWWLGLALNRLLYPFVRMYSGLELAPTADIGRGLWIGHFGPTRVHPATRAGDHLTLLHGVTIGSASGVPRLGSHVNVGTGAIIVGDIDIGDRVTVAAGAVVLTGIPADCLAIGNPARAIRQPPADGCPARPAPRSSPAAGPAATT